MNQEWDCVADSFDADNKTVTRSGVTGFSDWAIGDAPAPTGVTLLSFDVVRVDATTVRAEWSTGSERNLQGFHLWRSQGDLLFGTTYSFVDGPLQAETEYSYWL